MMVLPRGMDERSVVRLLRAAEGVVVYRGDGDPNEVDKLRIAARRPDLPVWFIGHNDGSADFRHWFDRMVQACRRFRNMTVRGEPT